jgi:hypothetical protein
MLGRMEFTVRLAPVCRCLHESWQLDVEALMPQKKTQLITPSVVSMIRPWRDEGLSPAEIAQKIGCTVGSLRVRCSQLKISLRRGASKREVEARDPLLVMVSPSTIGHLQNRAALKGLSHARLAATLLDRIAQDDLYDAVLDD